MERRDTGRRAASSAAAVETGTITRPVLLPWGDDAVWMAASPAELPVAYVSMAKRQLFVDFDYREQVYWDLRAHISVSTGVWRIPLVGDEPTIPVTPGDVEREFEELAMRDWDPTVPPAEGDIRVVRGRPVDVTVDFTCAPLSGGGAWYRAGPWSIRRCGAPGEALTREDFMVVGAGARFSDRECTRDGSPVRVLTWATIPELNPSDG